MSGGHEPVGGALGGSSCCFAACALQGKGVHPTFVSLSAGGGGGAGQKRLAGETVTPKGGGEALPREVLDWPYTFGGWGGVIPPPPRPK